MRNDFFVFLNKYNLYDKGVYSYCNEHALRFDYYNEDFFRGSIGCTYMVDKYGILNEIIPFIPNLVDDITTLINIHEYVHVLSCYDKLNQHFKLPKSNEILPIFYENLYISECNSARLKRFKQKLDELALSSNDDNYLMSLKVQDELISNYNNDSFSDLNYKAKSLLKKYH